MISSVREVDPERDYRKSRSGIKSDLAFNRSESRRECRATFANLPADCRLAAREGRSTPPLPLRPPSPNAGGVAKV